MTTQSSHGAATRQQVVHGGRPIPSLWQRQLKDGGAVYEASLRIDGKKKRVVLRARTPTEAIRELEALRVDRDRGTVNENPLINPTMTDLFDEWLNHLQARVNIRDEKRRIAQSTVDNHRTHSRHVQRVLPGRRIRDLTAHDLRRMVDQLESEGLAPGTVTTIMGGVNVALRFAVKAGYVDRNVWADVGREDRPGSKRLTEPRYLSRDELAVLFAQANDCYRPVYMVLFYAALRIREALGLVWSDIDLKAGTINVQAQLSVDRAGRSPLKTKASYATVRIPPALVRELVAHRSRQAEQSFMLARPEAFVFTSPQGPGRRNPADDGKGLAPSTLRGALNRDARGAGLMPDGVQPLSPHDLRHSAAAVAFESGTSVVGVCEMMRHANPRITLVVYAGLTKDGQGEAFRKMLDAGIGV